MHRSFSSHKGSARNPKRIFGIIRNELYIFWVIWDWGLSDKVLYASLNTSFQCIMAHQDMYCLYLWPEMKECTLIFKVIHGRMGHFTPFHLGPWYKRNVSFNLMLWLNFSTTYYPINYIMENHRTSWIMVWNSWFYPMEYVSLMSCIIVWEAYIAINFIVILWTMRRN